MKETSARCSIVITKIDFPKMFIREQVNSFISCDQIPNTMASMVNPMALCMHKLIKTTFIVKFSFWRKVTSTMMQPTVIIAPRIRNVSMK